MRLLFTLALTLMSGLAHADLGAQAPTVERHGDHFVARELASGVSCDQMDLISDLRYSLWSEAFRRCLGSGFQFCKKSDSISEKKAGCQVTVVITGSN